MFERDSELGHRLPLDVVVGHRRFVSWKAALRRAAAAEHVVLCLGDSSTSGWNGDLVDPNGRVLSSPFFTYPTYAQLLEETIDATVINAGVPGYSSLQGLLQVRRILARCEQHGVQVDTVTVYFGNNDATYGREDKVELLGSAPTPGQIERLSPADYRTNLTALCERVQAHGAEAILIEPVVNHCWRPGLRSAQYPNELGRSLAAMRDGTVRQMLLEALECFDAGDLQRALQLDVVLPRIKPAWSSMLGDVSKRLSVPLVSIPTPDDSDGWFLDYCHPLEPPNALIAGRIADLVGLEHHPRRPLEDPPERLLHRVRATVYRAIRALGRHRSAAPEEPAVYPLY